MGDAGEGDEARCDIVCMGVARVGLEWRVSLLRFKKLKVEEIHGAECQACGAVLSQPACVKTHRCACSL